MKSRIAALLRLLPAAFALSGCAIQPPPPLPTQHTDRRRDTTIWVLEGGWHTEIGIAARDVTGPLAVYRDIFPGAAVFLFGFGKRTWMTAKIDDAAELLMGPFPGPGTINAIGLRVAPQRAFPSAEIIQVRLTAAQSAGLAAFVWQAIGKTRGGEPRLISQGWYPGSLFYASSHGYGLDYTCNRWTADALQAAGLNVDPAFVVLAAGLMRQTGRLPDAIRLR